MGSNFILLHVCIDWTIKKMPFKPLHMVGYPDPSAYCINVGYVLAEEICFIFCKHEVRSKLFVYQDLVFTKYEADLLCQNMFYITTKGRGVRVSLPLFTSHEVHLMTTGYRGIKITGQQLALSEVITTLSFEDLAALNTRLGKPTIHCTCPGP